ncbi:hypothetical protein [Aromatoleum anaerobium]|uniref:Uncharacterized protein n=2 Tax=Aromatoleum TaxID=551759 RepID=A0ABX1PRK3_9RHOO|nr:hypothetical protein [Aromatoleum anaerobium]MCK0506327.1 hypothetical protein [Aromatoleum anaerobium]
MSEYVTLRDLLEGCNVTIATLATAIEQAGIYTWDRFGRFKQADEPAKVRVLDLLAAQYRWSTGVDGRDTGSPLTESAYSPDDVFSAFCWPTNQAPDFGAIHQGQCEEERPQRRAGDTKMRRTYETLIVALAKRAGIDCTDRGAAVRISEITELSPGGRIGEDTIRAILRGMP